MASVKRIGRYVRGDQGLTMIEIVASAVIFFFVLTVILGLIGTTTMMGTSSKQRTVMVNALNAYVERVQALPFEKVDVIGTGEGVLSVEETQSVGEFTISIRPTVSIPTTLTSVGDPTLKRLHVVMTIRRGVSGTPLSYTTDVLIRDKAQYLTQAVADDATDPKIAFTSTTPPEGTVVWESSYAGGALTIGVNVLASDGRLIDQVSLWSDDQYILESTLGSGAAWQAVDQQTWSSPSFIWNTLQQQDVLQSDGSYLAEHVIFDGMRTISAYVIDSSGISKYTVRHMLVDNVEPSTPGTPTATAQTNLSSLISWPLTADGTLPAPKYRISVSRQLKPVLSTDPDANWQAQTSSPYPSSTGLSYVFTTAEFARYEARVYAESPRGNASAWSPVGIPWCSRPSIDGTYTVTKSGSDYSTVSKLVASQPSFPTSSTPVYHWYRVESTGAVTDLGTTTTNTKTDTVAGPSKNNAAIVRYYATVTFAPAGRGAVEQGVQTLQTNTTTPTGSSTGYFDTGTW